MPAKNSLNTFYPNVTFSIAGIVSVGFLLWIYIQAEKTTDLAYELRHLSFLLADELRQSSDDLSRMARTYATTGNTLYKEHFQEIIDIRDGNKPRPLNYRNVYWDLVEEDDKRPRPASGETVSLLELMRRTQFTEQEFAKLAEAKKNSDALTKIERTAMQLVETNPAIEAKRDQALRMLYGTDFHRAKLGIMKPIGEFYDMMDQRTLSVIEEAAVQALRLRWALIGCSMLLLVLLWRTYRAMLRILGASPDLVYLQIARLGSGDFETEIPIKAGTENTVLGWLSETRQKLDALNRSRREAEMQNQMLTRLYATLSQCNQAIVRCETREELFGQICRDAVVFGGMKMVWIGMLDGTAITPVAWHGEGTEYLWEIQLSTNPNHPSGQGPAGIALREDRAFWCQNFRYDPATAAWHEQGKKYGWGASCALPLHLNGKVVGKFSLYCAEPDAFTDTIKHLLLEMTMDIDFALDNYYRRQQHQAAEKALSESHNLLRTVIDTAPVRVFWKDRQSRYLGCNPAFAHDSGEPSPEDIIGKDDFQLCWREQAEAYRADDRLVIESGQGKLFFEERQTTPDGKKIWLRTSKVPLRNRDNEIIGLLGIYENITAGKLAEEHIHFLANFDPLTGLPNRNNLNTHLNQALSLAESGIGKLILMFLDIDHFNHINDTLGHTIGDALLVKLAERLHANLREEDTATRLGGDEFIILLPDTDEKGAANIAQNLLDALSQPIRIEHYELMISASIGIALYPNDGQDLETLSKCADLAMYEAKRSGRQHYRFFTPEMQTVTDRNMAIINALRRAIEQNMFSLYYQPQVCATSGRIIGAEALLRWRHPDLGDVSPSEFIPLAEESGLIQPIGAWVLRNAARQAKLWQAAGFTELIVAVNLSVAQFRHPDLPDLVTGILAEENMPAAYLELELTEGVALHDPQGAIEVMDRLYDSGIRMSIDDFGTGYSSLNYLKKFKIYKLKIDKSFVLDISNDAEDRAIVEAIITLAKTLNLKTIAEGVETPEQLAFLQKRGCDEIQGYLCGKPLPAEEFGKLLTSRQA